MTDSLRHAAHDAPAGTAREGVPYDPRRTCADEQDHASFSAMLRKACSRASRRMAGVAEAIGVSEQVLDRAASPAHLGSLAGWRLLRLPEAVWIDLREQIDARILRPAPVGQAVEMVAIHAEVDGGRALAVLERCLGDDGKIDGAEPEEIARAYEHAAEAFMAVARRCRGSIA